MENLFSTKGVVEKTVSGNGQQYLYGGVYHKVVVSKITAGASKVKGTPQITVTLHTVEGGEAAARDFNLYFTPNTAEMSMGKLKHIATKIVTEAEFEAIESSSIEELAAALSALLKGQKLRMKFTAEEYENLAGEIKERANIGLPVFAEAIQEGAEYPVVADADTKLVFDKNNKYDFKKLPNSGPTAEADVANAGAGLGDL